MFTSDTENNRCVRKSFAKTALAYLGISALCIVITNVYAIFGHGIRSNSMDFMFLYPLVGGSLVFWIVRMLFQLLPESKQMVSRMGYNLYNSGIASLTSAAMLTDIMEIAGTGSKWIQYIKFFGIALLIMAAVCQAVITMKHNQ